MAVLANHVTRKPINAANGNNSNGAISSTNQHVPLSSKISKVAEKAESVVAPLLLTAVAGDEASSITNSNTPTSSDAINDTSSVSVNGTVDNTVPSNSSITNSNVNSTSKSEKSSRSAALSTEEKKAALIEVLIVYLSYICIHVYLFRQTIL